MDVTDKLNMTMLCDFYELTMGNGYFEAGLQNRITYFDVFFRATCGTSTLPATSGPSRKALPFSRRSR